jgi:hypothetical protein
MRCSTDFRARAQRQAVLVFVLVLDSKGFLRLSRPFCE